MNLILLQIFVDFAMSFIFEKDQTYTVDVGKTDEKMISQFIEPNPISKSSKTNIRTANEERIFLISGTSYFKPQKFELNAIKEYFIIFRSISGTQYISLIVPNSFVNKSVSFESVFIKTNQNNLQIKNLSLHESPLFCAKGLVNILVDIFTSDLLSIPSSYVDSVSINEHFYFIDGEDDQKSIESHAQITLLGKAKQSKAKKLDNKIISNLMKNDDDDILVEDNETNSTLDEDINATYDFNNSMRGLALYDDFITAIFYDSESTNLSANSSGEIFIKTSSSKIEITYFGKNSIRKHLKFKLHLTSECVLFFSSTFDLVSDSILEDIEIYHDFSLTVTSASSVPYVTITPIVDVKFIPEREFSRGFCMCLKSRFKTCFDNQECLLHGVENHDYFFGTNSSFTAVLAKVKNEIINIYVTSSGETGETHIIDLKQSSRSGKIYNFISVSNDVTTKISVQDTALDGTVTMSLTFSDISSVNLHMKTGVLTSLQMKNSPLTIEKSFEIPILQTDLISLTPQQKDSITVTNLLSFSRNIASTLGLNVILSKNAKLKIPSISFYPQITFSAGSISFSDGDSDFTIRVDDGGPAILEIAETNSKKDPEVKLINSNSNLKLLFQVDFSNSITMNFVEFQPPPENIVFEFIPGLLNSSLSFVMPEDPVDIPADAHLYHFKNITGDVNLVLLTPDTMKSFISAILRGDFYAMNISHFSINVLDSLSAVTLYEDKFDVNLSNITIFFGTNFVYGQLTLKTNSTKLIKITLGHPEKEYIPPFIIDSSALDCNIFFDDSFKGLQNDSNLTKSILIKHSNLNITLLTNLSAVPMVGIEDDVSGVLFEGKTKSFKLPNDEMISKRSGPEVLIEIDKRATVNQKDFLSKKVTFMGGIVDFVFKAKSRSEYIFLNAPIYVKYDEGYFNNISESIEASSLTLRESPIRKGNIVIVDYFDSDLYSIESDDFYYLRTDKMATINDEKLEKITIQEDCLYFSPLADYPAPTYTSKSSRNNNTLPNKNNYVNNNINENNKYISESKSYNNNKNNYNNANNVNNNNGIRNDHKNKNIENENEKIDQKNKSIARMLSPFFNTIPVYGSLFKIIYKGSSLINVTFLPGVKSLDQHIELELSGNSNKTVYLDKTWYLVENTKNFVIIVLNDMINLTIRTALMKLPEIVVIDKNGNPFMYKEELYKPIFTDVLSFYIFGVLAAIVTICSVVLLCVGQCCRKKEFTTEEPDTTHILGLAGNSSGSGADYED